MGERRVPWVSGRAGPDAPSRLRAWRTPRSDRRAARSRPSRARLRAPRLAPRPPGRTLQPRVGGPTGSLQAPSGRSHWEPASSQWDSQWDLARSHWEREWDFQSAPRKASGSTEGAPRSSHWDPRPLARRHRRVPLAGARRTPRAPTGRPRHYRARATSSGVPSYAKQNKKTKKTHKQKKRNELTENRWRLGPQVRRADGRCSGRGGLLVAGRRGPACAT